MKISKNPESEQARYGGKQLGFSLPIAILIAVVLIIAGGMGYYFYKTSGGPAKKVGEQLEECFTEMRVKPTKETQEKCQSALLKFKDFIKELKDPLICEQFERYEQFGMRNSCLSSVAKNLKDPSVCEKINPKGPQFPGPQSDCYKGVAVALKNYSICGKIISPASPELTSSCYTEVAVALNDPLGCEKIPEAMSRYEISFEERVAWAENYCYKKVAEILGDASMCEKIQKLDSRGRCWLTISETLKIDNPAVCGVIKELSEKRECYMNIIDRAENVEFCEKVQEQEFKDKCYARFAQPSDGGALCERIQDPKIKDWCYLRIAYSYGPYTKEIKQRLKFCEKIQDGFEQDMCKVTLKTSEGYEANFCEGLRTQRGKDFCYKVLAELKKNPEYCKKIQDRPEDVNRDYQHLREECEIRVERESTKK